MKVIVMAPPCPAAAGPTRANGYHPQPPPTRQDGTVNDLGTTLRAWRDRISPAAAGLPAGRSRRAKGLRREELAELAGISVDYLVRLEQGRFTSPSAQVAAALARALQLSAAERDHLYRLAGLSAPGAGEITDHIAP